MPGSPIFKKIYLHKRLAKWQPAFDHGCLMYRDQWMKFTWDLKSLPAHEPKFRASMRIRKGVDDSMDKIWACIERAYEMDQGWSVNLKQILESVEAASRKGFETKAVTFLLLEDGKRIVGVSGVDIKAPYQFLTGICVEDEYRCRGYGTSLLHATLSHIAENGLAEAVALSRQKVNASKYLYPKFGAKSEPLSENEIPYRTRP